MSCYLFNGPFKLIPTHKIPFLDNSLPNKFLLVSAAFVVGASEYFKWFMSYYNAIQTYIISAFPLRVVPLKTRWANA
jgi:hypothetical protein